MPILDGKTDLSLNLAAQAIAARELVALPTETVYGLGARADDDAAVAKIFAAKGRPAEHPLIVHVLDVDAATHFGDLAGAAPRRLALSLWPGPLTLIVPRRAGIAASAAGGQGTIGLRVPSHPIARALLQRAAELGVPGIAAPSANRFGRISPTLAQHVAEEFGPELLVLDGGACDAGIESTIVDCSGKGSPSLLRPGILSRERIAQVLGQALGERHQASPRASGTLLAHYAPNAKLRLMPSTELLSALSILAGSRPPQGLAVYSRTVRKAESGIDLQVMPESAEAAAHELFAVLRGFDARGARLIWVEAPPSTDDWEGVRDRLTRAAASS